MPINRGLRLALGDLIVALAERRMKIFDFSDRLFDLYQSPEIETDAGVNAVATYFLVLDTIVHDGFLAPPTEEEAAFIHQVTDFLRSDLEYQLATSAPSGGFKKGSWDHLPSYFPFASEEEARFHKDGENL